MPSYEKFMNEILTQKRRIDDDDELVLLSARCSVTLQSNLPPKLKDLRIITTPCSLCNFHIERALCDSRARINLMTLSIFKKLGVDELKQTNSTL